MSEALKKMDEEIASLRTSVTKLERVLKAKNAELEDRAQFSQCMADAQNGKYTSIFSLPFYTGRYGYKMCLRLYILGDGIGKNSYSCLTVLHDYAGRVRQHPTMAFFSQGDLQADQSGRRT